MSERDRIGFGIVALVAWLTSQPCPRTVEYRYLSADGRRGPLAKVGRLVRRRLTLLGGTT